MTRALAALLLVLGAFVLVAAACDSEDDFLLDESGPEATGTPPFFQRSPEPSPEPSPGGSPPAPEATPVTPFKVKSAETVNLRTEPSTEGGQETVAGALSPDDTATVTARVSGEAVSGDNDIWYQLEDGTFVYSGAVKEVEG